MKSLISKYIFSLILFLTIPVAVSALPEIEVEVYHGTCFADGRIVIKAKNTTGVVMYALLEGSPIVRQSTTDNEFTGLEAGTYYVGIYDETTGATPVKQTVELKTSYPGFQINAPAVSKNTSTGTIWCEDNGIITITGDAVKKGRAPYSCTITNRTTGVVTKQENKPTCNFTFSNLPTGNYYIDLVDDCGSRKVTPEGVPIVVSSDGSALKDITFTSIDFKANYISGSCKTLSIRGYSYSGVTIGYTGGTAGQNLASQYQQVLKYRLEYPAGSGDYFPKTTEGWLTFYSYGTFTNCITDYDPTSSTPQKYRIQVKHPCTGQIVTSPEYELATLNYNFSSISSNNLVYSSYCSYPTEARISLSQSPVQQGGYANSFSYTPCTVSYKVSAVSTDGTVNKQDLSWTNSNSYVITGLLPGKTYNITVKDGTTNAIVKTYTHTVREANSYMNRSAPYQYIYNAANYGTKCDFTTGEVYQSGVSASYAYTYSTNEKVTFTLISGPAGVNLSSYPAISSTSTNSLWLWRDLPFGTYKVRINYNNGCRTQDTDLILTQTVKGFDADAPTLGLATTCSKYTINAKGYFIKPDGNRYTISNSYYMYNMRVYDYETGKTLYGTSNTVYSNQEASVTNIPAGGKYRVRFYSNYTSNCYYAEKIVETPVYSEPRVDVVASGGIACSVSPGSASLTVKAKGDRPPFQFRHKVKGAGDDTYSPWVSGNVSQYEHKYDNLSPGKYEVEVANSCGDSYSGQELTIYNSGDQFLKIIGAVGDLQEDICEGRYVVIAVESIGPVLTYKWYKNGVLMPSVTGRYYEIPSASASDVGVYKVVIENYDCELSNSVEIKKVMPPAGIPTLTGEACVLSGSSIKLTAQSTVSNPSYRWFRNGELIKNESTSVYNAVAAGYYTVTVTPKGGCESDPSNIYIVSLPELYWRKDAPNYNWNDSINWVDKNNLSAGTIPCSSTNVFIPTKADKYPSLDSNTPVSPFGVPVCKDITFEYGAEIAYPHKLTYERAKVQYNWGYYGTFSNVSNKQQPSNPTDGNKKKRDQWYALAAPLKKMASGDFSFAGYPMSWQAVFNAPHPVTGEILAGDFSKSFEKNDIDLSETNNAVVVKVAVYDDKVGYKKHDNLEGLKGILEVPYFENSSRTPYHKAHSYDKIKKESKFFYFDKNTLQILNTPIGTMRRGDDAYRFVYEDDNKKPYDLSSELGSGVVGYRQKVKIANGGSQKVMVGNPFMSSINTQKFLKANIGIVDGVKGYEIYSSATQQWVQYQFTDNNHIGPLQAFIVTLPANIKEAELLYPLEGVYALTGAGQKGSIQRMPSGISLFVKAKDASEQESNYAVLELTNTDESDQSVKKMLSPEGHTTPEVFFIEPDQKEYNLVQYTSRGTKELPLAVKSSQKGSELTLSFENVNEFTYANGVRPVLVDKKIGREQDLLKTSVYRFTQSETTSEQQYSDNNRFVLRLEPHNDLISTESVKITYSSSTLSVNSEKIIEQVQVYDLYGRVVHNSGKLQVYEYTRNIPLPSGVYVVKVKTEDGDTKVEKIMAL